jgi:hypothetical protein
VSAVDPMLDVMGVAAAGRAAQKLAAPIASRQRAVDGRGDRPPLSADVEDGAVVAMRHGHHGGIAGEAPRRFRGGNNILDGGTLDG